MKDANNIRELIDLNDYMNEIEIGPQKIFIPACDLELFQIPNWVSIKNHLLKVKLILAHDLEMQVPTADITKNFAAKLFLEKTQACLTFNLKENINKPAFLEKTF